MLNENDLIKKIKGKKILYIATKNRDYIRVSQELNFLKKYALKVDSICFNDSSYIKRIAKVYLMLLIKSVRKYDIIFIGFMAQMIVPIWYRFWRNKEIIVDFFISIYDTLVFDRKIFKDGSLISVCLKKIDRCTIKKSRYILADTKAHARYFMQEFGAREKRLFVYYLKANVSVFHSMNIKKFPRYSDKFLVLYFGSILPVQGVEVVLETVEKLKERKDIHFIIIGPIGRKLKKVVSDTVTYIDWLSQDKLAKYIAMADLCLGGHFSATVPKAKRTIPGKVYIYREMKKKIVLGDSEANHELFSEHDEGIYFTEMGSAEALMSTILKIKDCSNNER